MSKMPGPIGAVLFLLAIQMWANAVQSAEPTYQRQAWILGWQPSGQNLLFREETRAEESVTIRAVVLEVEGGKVKKEFLLQDPEDKPDIVSVRENNLAVYMEKEGVVRTATAPLYIGADRQGFLSQNGQFLIVPKIEFLTGDSSNSKISLQIDFSLVQLKTAVETHFAHLTLESMDGEHLLESDSIGAVVMTEVHYSPSGKHLALVLEEKRSNFLITGIVTLRYPIALEETLAVREEVKPPAVENPVEPSPAPAVHSSLDLTAHRGSPLLSPDSRYRALHLYYEACASSGEPIWFGSQITIVDEKTGNARFLNVSDALDPKEVGLKWSDLNLEVQFLGETIRTLSAAKQRYSPEAKDFTLQLGSYSTEERAREHVRRLCDFRLPAYGVESIDPRSREPRFRVRVGRFPDEEKAKAFAQQNLPQNERPYLVTTFETKGP